VLESGDFFWLTYSGHGGQVSDTNSDDETDEKDETWVLYDRQLVDLELYALWGEFKPGVRIFVLSDSCHSGSVTRDIFDAAVPHVVSKGMVDDDQPRTKELPEAVEEATEKLYQEIQGSNPSSEKAVSPSSQAASPERSARGCHASSIRRGRYRDGTHRR
jgi:hypothetical protein